MHPALESEKLYRIDYVPHPRLGFGIAIDVVAAAVGGGRVVAVACQGVQVLLGGFVCPHTSMDGAAIGLWAPSSFYDYGPVMGGRLWRATCRIRRGRMRKR